MSLNYVKEVSDASVMLIKLPFKSEETCCKIKNKNISEMENYIKKKHNVFEIYYKLRWKNCIILTITHFLSNQKCSKQACRETF